MNLQDLFMALSPEAIMPDQSNQEIIDTQANLFKETSKPGDILDLSDGKITRNNHHIESSHHSVPKVEDINSAATDAILAELTRQQELQMKNQALQDEVISHVRDVPNQEKGIFGGMRSLLASAKAAIR